ncbi:hypothetical protein BDV95DRAFT_308498 [Massariosphaeria phaeospora]|uniref:RNase P subunit Pop3-domain-containing protein n=1 Tax=Massariosphaeria phaeospora TaxID=100035 RepID=A0A7C8MGX2_9PLEO|nr:hypothetical protein BDV95DRAFT_308498 [Massariosphaeria phaeospora]
MPPTNKKNSKPIFKADIPFTETTWPEVSAKDQDVILDLLCDLLTPLSHHRKTHIQPSRGKKRKRKANPDPENLDTAPPPPPEIGNHILVGLNSVTRHLEALVARTTPATLTAHTSTEEQAGQATNPNSNSNTTPLTLLIIPHSAPSSSAAHAHLPTLLHLSHLAQTSDPTSPTTPPPRLITLAPSSSPKLASALHVPRVSALGILSSAPGTSALLAYVRENIGAVECKWIDESLKGEWRGAKVGVTVPVPGR